MILKDQPVLYADRPTRNNWLYSTRLIENMLFRYQNDVKKRRMLGVLGNPTDTLIHSDMVSHLVTRLIFDGHVMRADVEILDTPHGNILRKSIEYGQHIVFRPYVVGSACYLDGLIRLSRDCKLISINALPADEAA